MLTGDLAAAPLASVLTQLADGSASGCLHLTAPDGETAKIYLRGGQVYAVLAPGRRPQLGARLVSGGALAPEALAEALQAQRTEPPGWRLGELLVHLGYVDQPVVEAFVNEQLRDCLSQLLRWRSGAWRLRINERTRDDVAPPAAVADLLADVALRRSAWARIVATVPGPDAVPMLSAAGSSDDQLKIDPDDWSLLCKVDGLRTLSELAAECGFTLHEAGQVVCTLVGAGLLEVEAPAAADPACLGDAEAEPVGTEPAAVAARLVRALTGLGAAQNVPAQSSATQQEHELASYLGEAHHLERPADDAAIKGSISRVSEALSAALGPAATGDDLFSAPLHRAARTTPPAAPEDPNGAERARREAERRDDLLGDGHVADVVDLQEVRREVAAEAARLAAHAAETQATAFAELSAAASIDMPEPVAAEPEPTYGNRDTDTASLLRELSSLGQDDDPAPLPVTRPARATATRPVSAAAQKKRKGLFGRG